MTFSQQANEAPVTEREGEALGDLLATNEGLAIVSHAFLIGLDERRFELWKPSLARGGQTPEGEQPRREREQDRRSFQEERQEREHRKQRAATDEPTVRSDHRRAATAERCRHVARRVAS